MDPYEYERERDMHHRRHRILDIPIPRREFSRSMILPNRGRYGRYLDMDERKRIID